MGLREKKFIHELIHEKAPAASQQIGSYFHAERMPIEIDEAGLQHLDEELLERFETGALKRLTGLMIYFSRQDDFTVQTVQAAIKKLHIACVDNSAAKNMEIKDGTLRMAVNPADPANGYFDEVQALQYVESLL